MVVAYAQRVIFGPGMHLFPQVLSLRVRWVGLKLSLNSAQHITAEESSQDHT